MRLIRPRACRRSLACNEARIIAFIFLIKSTASKGAVFTYIVFLIALDILECELSM